jgi:Protein of unknown function (DUF2778)
MNLNYSQTSGLVTDDTGITIAKGWAGKGKGKNNPAEQAEKCVGPLPQGKYTVQGWYTHPNLGPLVARLIQVEGETFGRDAFYIHGPASNPEKYGQESKGCVVVPRHDREKIASLLIGPGHTLTVTV